MISFSLLLIIYFYNVPMISLWLNTRPLQKHVMHTLAPLQPLFNVEEEAHNMGMGLGMRLPVYVHTIIVMQHLNMCQYT